MLRYTLFVVFVLCSLTTRAQGVIVGVSCGPTVNRDDALTGWCKQNGLKYNQPPYINFDVILMGADGKRNAGGFLFSFGGAAHSNYPSKLNIAFFYGYHYSFHGLHVYPTMGLGGSFATISLADSVPASLTQYHLSKNSVLKQTSLLLNPSLKFFIPLGRKDNQFTIGVDVGAKLYPLQSGWAYSDVNRAHSPSISVTGVPDTAFITYYFTIFFGLSAH